MGAGEELKHSENPDTMLYKEQNKITIADVAASLGISKTTVSRAISGKGRIGEETRKRVLDYIVENNYHPNVAAKGLAKSKTYNIGWVVPGDSRTTDLPFFQRCLIGVNEVAAGADYDILISMVYDNDDSQLARVIRNKKVDGVILGRTLVDDSRVRLLLHSDIPFVVIGSTPNENVVQIDNDHISACRELTSVLLMKGIQRIALIGGDSNHVVNQTRKQGFEQAVRENRKLVRESWVYMDSDNDATIDRLVDEIRRNGAECIVCMDDRICHSVLIKCARDGIMIPGQIKVASFYNSDLLANHKPGITALEYDPKELGSVACKTLLDYINGIEVQKKVFMNHEIFLKGSTL